MPANFEEAGRKIGETTRQLEDELQRVVKYLNDEVVPKVRVHGSDALRTAAEQLSRLADRMDARKSAKPEAQPK
jgi:hypothetical protein